MNERPGTQDRDERDERIDRGDEEGFLPAQRVDDLQRRWNEVQAAFVDDPQKAVEQAHALVDSTVTELTETFTNERANLDAQWNRGQKPDTEELRVALKRYHEFFDRLLPTG